MASKKMGVCDGCRKVKQLPARDICSVCRRDKRLMEYAPLYRVTKTWTPEEEARLTEMRSLNIPLKDIAKALGRSSKQIKTKSSRMGLSHKKKIQAVTKQRCWVCDAREPRRSDLRGWVRREFTVSKIRIQEVYCPDCVRIWGLPDLPDVYSPDMRERKTSPI